MRLPPTPFNSSGTSTEVAALPPEVHQYAVRPGTKGLIDRARHAAAGSDAPKAMVESALRRAGKKGNVHAVNVLSDPAMPGDVNAESPGHGHTALQNIARRGNKEALIALLSRDAVDRNASTPKGVTAMLYAVERGDPEIVKILARDRKTKHIVTPDGNNSPLVAAAKAYHLRLGDWNAKSIHTEVLNLFERGQGASGDASAGVGFEPPPEYSPSTSRPATRPPSVLSNRRYQPGQLSALPPSQSNLGFVPEKQGGEEEGGGAVMASSSPPGLEQPAFAAFSDDEGEATLVTDGFRRQSTDLQAESAAGAEAGELEAEVAADSDSLYRE